MIDKSFIFLAGHHRSGTSLIHEIIRENPLISGFSQTGVPEDEGQHLQSVFESAKRYGGPGKYIHNKKSYMNENHFLATEKSAEAIFRQWERYYDTSCIHYVEKSPPNLIRTRFLQKLFQNSKFVVVMRHPLAVSYATQKWSRTSIKSLVEHTLTGYEIFMKDMAYLNNVYVVRYEEFVLNPQNEIDKIFGFLGLKSLPIQHSVISNINEKYFSMWEDDRKSILKKNFPVSDELEKRTNKFGYSIHDYRELLPSLLLGPHNET
jgi:hypothetical protein|tara:strand:+ start:5400 stop:6188 length:789 start_codon:yes stop_codon:yes gene_type:complete